MKKGFAERYQNKRTEIRSKYNKNLFHALRTPFEQILSLQNQYLHLIYSKSQRQYNKPEEINEVIVRLLKDVKQYLELLELLQFLNKVCKIKYPYINPEDIIKQLKIIINIEFEKEQQNVKISSLSFLVLFNLLDNSLYSQQSIQIIFQIDLLKDIVKSLTQKQISSTYNIILAICSRLFSSELFKSHITKNLFQVQTIFYLCKTVLGIQSNQTLLKYALGTFYAIVEYFWQYFQEEDINILLDYCNDEILSKDSLKLLKAYLNEASENNCINFSNHNIQIFYRWIAEPRVEFLEILGQIMMKIDFCEQIDSTKFNLAIFSMFIRIIQQGTDQLLVQGLNCLFKYISYSNTIINMESVERIACLLIPRLIYEENTSQQVVLVLKIIRNLNIREQIRKQINQLFDD